MSDRPITIRLRPSSTSYAEFMRISADALGLPAPDGKKVRPNPRVLALMRLEDKRGLHAKLDNPSPSGYPVEV